MDQNEKNKVVISMPGKSSLLFLVFLSIVAFGIIPLKVASATNLLINPGLNTGTPDNPNTPPYYGPATTPSTGSIAPNWQDNSFGNVGVAYSDCRWPNTPLYEGSDSQKIIVSSIGTGGGVQFLQNYNFAQGHSYRASVWLYVPSTSTPVKVELDFRENAGPSYTIFGSNKNITVPADDQWHQYFVAGSFDQDVVGRFQIQILSTGTLYVDDADLEDYSDVVHTNVGSATDHSQATIQNAVNIANPGDTLVLAAGTYDFPSTVTINKSIQIEGTLDSNGNNLTVLQNTYTSSSPQALFYITADNVRISQLDFQGKTSDDPNFICYDEGIMGSNIQRFCIKNCNFSNFGVAGVSIYGGNSKGVVSNCYFTDIYRNTMTDLGYGVLVKGDGIPANWPTTPLYGMANGDNAVYVEDCHFLRVKHAIASGNSSKYVFRFNNCKDCGGTGTPVLQSVDAHGNESGNTTGSRTFEIYGNTIDYPLLASQSNHAYAGICIRGGDGMIYGNTVYNAGWPIVVENLSPVIPPPPGSTYPVLNDPPYSLTQNLYAWGNHGMQYGDPTYKYNGGGDTPLQVQLLPAPGDDLYLQEGVNFHNVSGPPNGYTMYTDPHPLAAN